MRASASAVHTRGRPYYAAGLCSVLWKLKRDLDVALCPKIVDFIWHGKPAGQLCLQKRRGTSISAMPKPCIRVARPEEQEWYARNGEGSDAELTIGARNT